MDWPVWFMLAALLVAVQADPKDQGPQVFSGSATHTPPAKEVQKREQKYEIKEVIMYLTPSQIRSLESGESMIQVQHQTLPTQPNNIENSETNRKHRLHLAEATPNTPSKEKEEDNLKPENNIPPPPQVEQSLFSSNINKHEQPLELQSHSAPIHHPEQQLVQNQPQLEIQQPHHVSPVHHHEQQHIPSMDTLLEHIKLLRQRPQRRPQNYAYLYLYPKGRQINTDSYQMFHPNPYSAHHKELVFQSEHHPNQQHHPNFQLIPYEYGLQSKLEAQQILQGPLVSHNFGTHQFENIDAVQLQPHKHYGSHYHEHQSQQLEAAHQAAYEAQQLQDAYNAQKLQDHHFRAGYEIPHENVQVLQVGHETHQQHSGYDVQNLEAQHFQRDYDKKLEGRNIQAAYEAHHKTKELDLEEFQRQQIQEVMEAQKLKKKLQAEEQEAHKLDAQLEAEQQKAEVLRQEQKRLEFLRKLEPKRTQMHSVLMPLFQGHNIAESLTEQVTNFPHHKIYLERGFKPLQYAPKFNGQKYVRDIEKVLRGNVLEKENAKSNAEYLLSSEIVQSEEVVSKGSPVEIMKHVTIKMPTTVFVPIPKPFEVKVPQPYPVPLEIIRPIPVPIVKMEKVEVEKPVPVEVEKRVPVPVTKNVYVKVNKPYIVKKVVPIEVQKEIPVEIPVRSNQKLSIIRHIWEH